MKTFSLNLLIIFAFSSALYGQLPCDPSLAPENLQAVYTDGFGLFLSWNAVPGSQGVQIKVVTPSGAAIKRFVVGPEPSEYFVPDGLLEEGTYTWRVQAACTLIPPFNVTPVSDPNEVLVGLPLDTSCNGGFAYDIEGNAYELVRIGTQCWMKENLRSRTYNNGDMIDGPLSNEDWESNSAGAYAIFNSSPANEIIYGLLYNFNVVQDSRGVCPAGFHIPSDEEWFTLTDHYGGMDVAGGALKSIGTVGTGGLWVAPNVGATNNSGFTALPGGERKPDGSYVFLGYYARFWSTTAVSATTAYGRRLYNNRIDVNRDAYLQKNGFYIRCVKD